MHMFVFLCLLISTLSLKYCYFPPPPIMSVTLHHCPKIPSFSCPLFFHHEQHFRVCFQFGVAFTSALTFLHSMSKLISIIFFLFFRVILLSSNSFHVTANCSISFFLMAEYYSYYYNYPCFPLSSFWIFELFPDLDY